MACQSFSLLVGRQRVNNRVFLWEKQPRTLTLTEEVEWLNSWISEGETIKGLSKDHEEWGQALADIAENDLNKGPEYFEAAIEEQHNQSTSRDLQRC